jgi:metalloprotease
MALLLGGCENTDLNLATQAGVDAIRAIALDDEDVTRMALQVAQKADQEHAVAPPGTPYAERLKRLVGSVHEVDGRRFEFKVYISPAINAFALADGSIRVYSGLMDLMDDEELLFVLGHEMGHVVEEHAKEKIRLAYAGSAVRKAVASQRSEAGQIAGSALGALAEALLNAQFSQQEERQADDYGLRYLLERGGKRESAVSALKKLAEQGDGHSFLSSHPAPSSRAKRLMESSLAKEHDGRGSILERAYGWMKGLWPFGGQVGDESAGKRT